ncbi:heptaprenyl diphosphate synthase component 1 [Fredinandcohnia humi]
MIDLQDIKKKIADLKGLIENKIKHSYLQKFVEVPEIDEDKIILLYSIYDDLRLPGEQLENYILTTMLVHQALDTHETVPNQLYNSNDHVRIQQLKVLAGDYFSGLYYYLLSQSDDISLIRTLAEGIKEVNESKIYLYQQDNNQIDKLFSCIETIESAIVRKIVKSFEIKKWEDIATTFLLLKRLVHERELYMTSGSSILFETLKNILFPKQQQIFLKNNLNKEQEAFVLRAFDKQFENVVQTMEKVLYTNSNINELLRKRMNDLLSLSSNFTMNKIVEEG